MNANAKAALCTALAIAAFALAYVPLHLTATISGVAALAVLVATWIALPRKREAAEIELAPGITQATLEAALAPIRAAAASFGTTAATIQDPPVSQSVHSLARTCRAIADELAGDPKDLRRAWDFVDYHLQQATRIVDSYAKLDHAPDKSEDERQRLTAVGQAILEIETLFTNQLRALRAEDFAKLSEDVTAMKTIALRVDSTALPARAAPGA